MKYTVYLFTGALLFSCNANKAKDQHPGHNQVMESGNYEMRFNFNPQVPSSPAKVQISLTPVRKGTDSIVSLEVQHEKKIHLIVVSEDLASFRHLHPVEQPDETFTIADSFKTGGKYLLYADFKPFNAEKEVTQQQLNISGVARPAIIYKEQSLHTFLNGFDVSFQIVPSSLVAGKELMFAAEIMRNKVAIPADSLENYLGEKAHMVIIGVSNKKYLHVHPMVMGGKLMLHTTFPEPGIYRAWLEFKKNGIVNTADFVINVSPVEAKPEQNTSESHKH